MDKVREDLKKKTIRKLIGLVKRPKNKKEVWRSHVRASSSAQPTKFVPTEEKKEEKKKIPTQNHKVSLKPLNRAGREYSSKNKLKYIRSNMRQQGLLYQTIKYEFPSYGGVTKQCSGR